VAHFQFRTKPVIVGSIVAQGDSESSGYRFDVHGLGASTVCVLKAA